MHIKLLVSAIAIALVATVGSASAAERFATLDGIAAESMSAAELSSVAGAGIIVQEIPTDLTIKRTLATVEVSFEEGLLVIFALRPAEFHPEVNVDVPGG